MIHESVRVVVSRLAAALLLTSVLAGCSHRLTPIHGAIPWGPPAVYAEWWRDVEVCSGASGDFDSIRWFIVPGVFFEYDGRLYDGFWAPPDRIVIAEERRLDADVVRHEMLHMLLGEARHPAVFGQACASLVGARAP